MSTATFPACVKATIDKLANSLALAKGVRYVDLDDVTMTAELFRSEDTAIVMEYNTLEKDPDDPLYAGSFHIGARTVRDPGNYSILKLVGDVEDLFQKGMRIEVKDSYEELETGIQGVIFPGDTSIMSQQYDMVSGIRLIEVTFKAQRFL